MKKSKRREPAVIRAWAEEEDKKITIQIEDGDGETLAFIQLTPDKATGSRFSKLCQILICSGVYQTGILRLPHQTEGRSRHT